MIFRPYYYYDTGCAAYVFGCGTIGECAVVDPQERDIPSYVDFAAQKSMKITHVIDTHVHADHRSGGRELAKHSGVGLAFLKRLESGDENLHLAKVLQVLRHLNADLFPKEYQ